MPGEIKIRTNSDFAVSACHVDCDWINHGQHAQAARARFPSHEEHRNRSLEPEPGLRDGCGNLDIARRQENVWDPPIPYQTWLYDPTTQRFVDTPEILQGICGHAGRPPLLSGDPVLCQWAHRAQGAAGRSSSNLQRDGALTQYRCIIVPGGGVIGCFGLAPIHLVTTTRISSSGKKCTYTSPCLSYFSTSTIFDFGICVASSGISQPTLTVSPGATWPAVSHSTCSRFRRSFHTRVHPNCRSPTSCR